MKFETKYNIGDVVIIQKDSQKITGKILLISIMFDGVPSSNDISYLVSDCQDPDTLIKVEESEIFSILNS